MDFIEQSSNICSKPTKNTTARCEICSQLAIKLAVQCYNCSTDITVNFKHVPQRVPLSLLLTFNK